MTNTIGIFLFFFIVIICLFSYRKISYKSGCISFLRNGKKVENVHENLAFFFDKISFFI